jgi:hypothetical protein
MGGMLGGIQPGGSGGAGAFKSLGSLGGNLQGTGSTLTGMGTPQLAQAGGYFSSLAGGNRATMTQALSPEISQINSVYGGTARTLSRFLRGPTKDVQMAEGERQRGGQIGSLFASARPQANAALAQLGGQEVGQGIAAQGTAGSLFGTQANLGQQADIANAQLQSQAGQGFGGLLFNLLKTFAKPGAAAAGG